MKQTTIQQMLWAALFTVFLSMAHAADFTVNQVFDGADAAPGDGACATAGGNCTLRAAVMETNALVGADTITIPAGIYTLALGSTGEDLAAEGDLDILDDLTITGADPATTTINGNSFAFRVFSILKRADNSLPVVVIKNLTLTQGKDDYNNNGALIYNVGELTLDNVTLTDASPDSYAMVNEGNFTLTNSRVSGNAYGIYNNSYDIYKVGKATISDSVFSNNISTGGGSALLLMRGTSTISNTLFTANEGDVGGAIMQSPYAATLNLDNCTFTGNKANRAYDGVFRTGGGAIYSEGNIQIANSRFEGNQTLSHGGALYVEDSPSVEILDTTFSNNIADNSGGGIYVKSLFNDFHATKYTMKRVAMNGNQATNGDGGAIYTVATGWAGEFRFSENTLTNNTAGNVGGGMFLTDGSGAVLSYSEVSGNTAAYGGGLFIGEVASVSLDNLTITGNTATVDGGGLYQNGFQTTLVHVTLANNVAATDMAANIANEAGTILLNNSLISVPTGNINCSGTISTLGYNLSSDASCGLGVEGDQSNTNPLLMALADNGGFSKTMALQTGSPAIDAGSVALCASLSALDQRYYYRTDAACDIGAYEAGSVRAQSGTLAFSSANFNVGEAGGTAVVTFSRTGGSEGGVSIPVFDTGLGTAVVGNNDYNTIPSTWIEWEDGDSSDKTLNISIIDDNNFEDNETILLQLGSTSGGASLGASAATVTIVNDDLPGEIRFSGISYTVAEGDRYAIITVERTNGTTPVSITYTTTDGSGIAGTDYTTASNYLYFGEGMTRRDFRVYITNNNLTDGDRTINLTLSNPQSGATLGTPSTAVLTIQDDETGGGSGVIAFETGLYLTSENDSTMTYTLVRTGGTDGVVSVDVTLEDGSALFGSDYNASSKYFTATFKDGEAKITGTITIIDDSTIEPEESLIIRLSNPQGGATLGIIDGSAVTIADNDTANDDSGGSGGDSGGGGSGAMDPLLLLLLGLLLGPTIRRRKQL